MAVCLGVFRSLEFCFLPQGHGASLQLALSLGRAAAGYRAATEVFVEVPRPCPPHQSQNDSEGVGGKAWPLWCCFLCRSCLDPGFLLVHRETEPGWSRIYGAYPKHQWQSRELNLLNWVPCLSIESLDFIQQVTGKGPRVSVACMC